MNSKKVTLYYWLGGKLYEQKGEDYNMQRSLNSFNKKCYMERSI